MMVQTETELFNHAHDDGKSYRNVVLRKLKADNVLNNNKRETRCYFSMQNALNILFTETRVSENCQDNVLLHLGNNGYANASQSYVTRVMPTLFKIQATTLPQPITITPIFIRHPSRNDPFHSLPNNNPDSQVTLYAINVHTAQRAERGTEAEGRKVILRNVDVQTVS